MKQICKYFWLFALLAWGFCLGGCVLEASDEESVTTTSSTTSSSSSSTSDDDDDDGDTVVSAATGADFSAANTIYINLSTAKISADNASWSSISSDKVTLLSETVSVKLVDDELIKVDATGITATLAIRLSGTMTSGGVKIQTSTSYETGVYLNSVSITSSDYPCLDITKGGAVTLFLSGENTLTEGRTYGSDYSSTSDHKGTLYCKGALALCDADGSSGTATLKITQNYKSCIASKSNISIASGTYTLTSTAVAVYDSTEKDYNSPACINADGNLAVTGGSVTGTASGKGSKGITVDGTYTQSAGSVNIKATGSNMSYSSASANAKGVKVDGAITVTGGKLYATSTSHEAIESKSTITISGGEVYGYSAADDGINASSTFTISGGYVCGYAPGNDGLDANGNFYIKGGVVFAVGSKSPEVAIDANTEGGYKLYISGGTIITLGPLESGSSLSQSCYSASWSANTTYGVTVGSTTYVFTTPSNSSSYGSGMVVSGSSTPTVTSGASTSGGTSYFDGQMYVGGTAGSTSVTLSSYSASSGGSAGGGNTSGGSMGGNNGGPSGGRK